MPAEPTRPDPGRQHESGPSATWYGMIAVLLLVVIATALITSIAWALGGILPSVVERCLS